MADIERTLREAMAAHADEAPTAAQFRPVPPRHRSPWLPAAAAAVVVAVASIAAVTIARSNHHSATRPPGAVVPLTCPQVSGQAAAGVRPWVPASPAGLDGSSRLVPDVTPTHAVVCAYLPPNPPASPPYRTTGAALTGSVELTGDLSGIPTDLTWMPRQLTNGRLCDAMLQGTDNDNYLLGLTYPDGTLWVGVHGNHCSGSSNGQFVSTANLRAQAAASYAAGTWQPPPTPRKATTDADPCWDTGPGRVGQDAAMVPAAPTSVLICKGIYLGTKTEYSSASVTSGFDDLVNALNAPATTPSTLICHGTGNQSVHYELIFRYAVGTAVHVRVDPHCDPSIDNTSLQAVDSTAVVAVIEQLLAASH